MKNQCHEPSSTFFIHLASSSLHLGGDLLDNHSVVSISLKNVIVAAFQDEVSDSWVPLELLSQLRLSVALLIISLYHPALQLMNVQSGLGAVTTRKHTDQEDSF